MKNQSVSTHKHGNTLISRIDEVLTEKAWTARHWSMLATGKPDTIRNIQREKSSAPRHDTLSALADAAGKTVDWLLGREDMRHEPEIRTSLADEMHYQAPRPGQSSVPIMGTGAGGQDGFVDWNGEVIGYIPTPPELIGAVGAYSVYVSGNSMNPRYFDGELVHVHPGKPVRPGGFVLVQMRVEDDPTPRALIKQFKRKTATSVILHQFNPDRDLTFPLSHVLHVHRIVGSGEG